MDYLKIDIEYSEWEALDAAIEEANRTGVRLLHNVKQFAMEIHTREVQRFDGLPFAASSKDDYLLYRRVFDALQRAGFRRWYLHSNMIGEFEPKSLGGVPITCCYEMVFLNMNYL